MFLFFVYTFWLFSDLCTKYLWKKSEWLRISLELMVLCLELSQAYIEYVVIQESTDPGYTDGLKYIWVLNRMLLICSVCCGVVLFLFVKHMYNSEEFATTYNDYAGEP